MNFVVWPDCADKRSRSVHVHTCTVNNLMHNVMHLCANTTPRPGFAGCPREKLCPGSS